MLNDRSFTCDYGVIEPVSPLIRRVVAKNPGPFTFRGTGTYVVGHGRVAIIDPGPDLAEHVDAVLAALAGETVTHILITHTHRDHSPAAAAVKRATGAPTLGFGPHGVIGEMVEAGADLDFAPDRRIGEGDAVEGPGWRLAAVHTPGHTSNHLCFALAEERALFSGDHVMGWSTTVIAPPDGNMADYMAALERLGRRADQVYWPTHGGAIRNPQAHVRDLIAHRRGRRDAILAVLAGGAASPAELVPRIYRDLDPRLAGAAARSVLAHLIELAERGAVAVEGERWRMLR
jgi:glyoxylase-like metal-dependent hydrolase (beta-lactamase superfamily II)